MNQLAQFIGYLVISAIVFIFVFAAVNDYYYKLKRDKNDR